MENIRGTEPGDVARGGGGQSGARAEIDDVQWIDVGSKRMYASHGLMVEDAVKDRPRTITR
jgi:hypothetical protein